MAPEEMDALADRFFAAIERGDLDEVASLYADDATVWHNSDGIDQPKADNLAVLAWMVANLADRRYGEIRRIPFDGGIVQQHVLTGTTRTGARLELPCMMRIAMADGRITRIEEYLDTAQLAVLRA